MKDEEICSLFNSFDINYVSGHGSLRYTTDATVRGGLFSKYEDIWGSTIYYWKLLTTDVGYWYGDCEWIVFAACSVLVIDLPDVNGFTMHCPQYLFERDKDGDRERGEEGEALEWGKEWAKTLVSPNGNPAHGILGYRDGSRGIDGKIKYDSDIAVSFVNNMKSGKSMATAWIEANLAHRTARIDMSPREHYYSGANAVALMHTQNVADTLERPMADCNGSEFTYIYIQWKYDEDADFFVRFLPVDSVAEAIASTTFTLIP
jgi:hypothetical protein